MLRTERVTCLILSAYYDDPQIQAAEAIQLSLFLILEQVCVLFFIRCLWLPLQVCCKRPVETLL